MCLATPMLLINVQPDGTTGLADLDGVSQQVDLSLLDSPQPGDYIIVHAGFAIEKLDTREADARLALFQELATQQRKEP